MMIYFTQSVFLSSIFVLHLWLLEFVGKRPFRQFAQLIDLTIQLSKSPSSMRISRLVNSLVFVKETEPLRMKQPQEAEHGIRHIDLIQRVYPYKTANCRGRF